MSAVAGALAAFAFLLLIVSILRSAPCAHQWGPWERRQAWAVAPRCRTETFRRCRRCKARETL